MELEHNLQPCGDAFKGGGYYQVESIWLRWVDVNSNTITELRIEKFRNSFTGSHEKADEHIQKSIKKVQEFLDRNYEEGFGTQQLDGTVWMSDGSWFERYEYDGSEHWVYKVRPKFPTEEKSLRLRSSFIKGG
jgi:hypothetical protein